MKKSKVLSIILLSLCIAAVIGLVAVDISSAGMLDSFKDIDSDAAQDSTMPGAFILAWMAVGLGIGFFWLVGNLIFALIGWIMSLAGIKVAANRIFKGIFIGLMVYFSITVLLAMGIILFIALL